jgi:FMN phosphatase YigB (HAD superfamily)
MEILYCFDLDGTLYKWQRVVWEHTLRGLLHYFRDILGLPVDMTLEEQRRMKAKWETNHTILAYIYEFDLNFDMVSEVVASAIEEARIEARIGAETIRDLPGDKLVFTNSAEVVAQVLLKKIGMLDDTFTHVIGLSRHLHSAKPHARSYSRVPKYKETIMVDDIQKNLLVPHQLGWHTAWFPEEELPDSTFVPPPHIHHQIRSLADLHHIQFRSH